MRTNLKLLIASFSAIILAACSSYEDIEGLPLDVQNPAYGTWTDTTAMQPKGYYVTQLDLNSNGSFVLTSHTYGAYTNQTINDLSGYYEYYGNYVLSSRNIYFVSKQSVSWDSFTGGNAITTVKDLELFKSCTYVIKNDTLELTYITYPADAPVSTKQIFKKTTKK